MGGGLPRTPPQSEGLGLLQEGGMFEWKMGRMVKAVFNAHTNHTQGEKTSGCSIWHTAKATLFPHTNCGSGAHGRLTFPFPPLTAMHPSLLPQSPST